MELESVWAIPGRDGADYGSLLAADRMNKAPRDYFRVLGEVIDLRSEGIRNLSCGDGLSSKDSEPPLLPGTRHYVVCGLLARSRQHPVNALFGDALVQEPSALGRERKGWTLAGEASFTGVDHIRLARHPDIAAADFRGPYCTFSSSPNRSVNSADDR